MLSGGTDPAESGGKLHVAATPATDATVAEAARLAGSQPVGSHHLLLAALTDSTSAAAKALASAGIDLDQAAEALRNVDIEGTSDEQPEQAGRRQMNIQVTDELVTIVATDPAIVEAGRTALLALGTHGEGAETPPPGGVIRGADLQGTAATSLATAWQSLMDTLVQVTHAAGQPDNPDQPETEAS
ncbi:MAG TPA: Clp protease N-terminal domain-containing protein [Streptosporangiaceae bacterium]